MEQIGKRLREERNRLRLNQQQMAGRGGVQPQAQVRYEKGDRKPDASYLVGIAAHGVDVAYVLTGTRSEALLSAEEWKLVGYFRALDRRGKTGLLTCANVMAPEVQVSNDNSVNFNAPVAQQIQSAVFHQPVNFNNTAGGDGKKI